MEPTTELESVTSSLPRTRSTNWATPAYKLNKLAYYMVYQKNSSRSWKNFIFSYFNESFLRKFLEYILVMELAYRYSGCSHSKHDSLDTKGLTLENLTLCCTLVISTKWRTICKSFPFYKTRSRESESTVIRVIPVGLIVFRFKSWLGKIWKFISMKSCWLQPFGSWDIFGSDHIFTGKMSFPVCRIWFILEHIDTHMLRNYIWKYRV